MRAARFGLKADWLDDCRISLFCIGHAPLQGTERALIWVLLDGR